MNNNEHLYTTASLFCGAGGLDIGFHQAGFSCIWANDFNKDACETFGKWSNAIVVCGDIGKVDYSEIPATDVINGGFPCFVAGTRVLTSSGRKPIEDVCCGDSVLTHTGYYRRVLRAGCREGAQTVIVSDVQGRTIECTPEHPVQARKIGGIGWDWIPAGQLGDDMEWREPEHSTWHEISSVKPGRTGVSVYNLDVSEDHSYTANGVSVHNCQGFSAGGPRKLDDSRNALYRHFVRLVDEKKPKAFVAENVRGLLTIGGSDEVARAILHDFAEKGYDVSLTLVNAADYGVPEDRMRIIMVGIRKDLGRRFYMPKPFAERKTLGDALSEMGESEDDEVCESPYSSRYMSRNRKRRWDQQSFTIPAMAKQVPLWPGSPDMRKIDGEHWEFGDTGGNVQTRRLSWREAAAVQTFPVGMSFVGNLTSKYRQVGNAVPPQLGFVVASRLKEILDGSWELADGGDWIEPDYTSWS